MPLILDYLHGSQDGKKEPTDNFIVVIGDNLISRPFLFAHFSIIAAVLIEAIFRLACLFMVMRQIRNGSS